jgi:hypothetical protein
VNGKRPGGWVALAWRYYRDPKFAAVSDEAELLYLRALCYSGEQDTDGKVPRNLLESLRKPAPNPDETTDQTRPKRATTLARQLVRAGLWIETVDGYAVPFDTWSRWQDTAEQRATARARTAERVARWRDKRRVSNASRNAIAGEGAGAGAGHRPVPPAPSAVEFEFETGDDGYVFVRPPALGQLRLAPGQDSA